MDLSDKSLSELAVMIRCDWKNVYFGAKPYLDAMATMQSIDEDYGCDSGKSVVLYFLANANVYRGDLAREIKKELKKRAGIK